MSQIPLQQLVADLLVRQVCNKSTASPLEVTGKRVYWTLGVSLHTQYPHRSVLYRVRTILALGYWVLGNICRCWVVLLLGDILFRCDTQYNTDQTAVGTVHMITILTSAVRPLSADDGKESGEGIDCKLYIIIIQLRFYVV